MDLKLTLTLLFSFSNYSSLFNRFTDSTHSPFFYTLCAAYSLISLIALIQLIRIELRVPEYGWTTQKIFHLFNFIVSGVRALVFGFHAQVFLLHPKARSLPTDKLRIVYIAVNGTVYLIQVGIWIYLWLAYNDTVDFIGKIFIGGVSFAAALGFLIFGGRLFSMLKRFPIESKGRRKKLQEVGFVTAICFTCFLIRSVMVLVSAFDSDASLDVLDHPILDFVYYMVVEILPSALVLFILRKLPPKRISAQYHDILNDNLPLLPIFVYSHTAVLYTCDNQQLLLE
ncbi:hypothetical protein TSUD_380760 [Trifolium subterraneum]|uniref:THH1/TOM1/TOM3 domain-containing protein n=1 Tax=Trifolium subterraneum TaxID=3900 RepID=A0A2Z6NB29_TRISU|nr:hypothetical protein TSUD_380760 [Trifolium subterraneum]